MKEHTLLPFQEQLRQCKLGEMMSGRQEPEPQSVNSADLLHPPDIIHTFLTV